MGIGSSGQRSPTTIRWLTAFIDRPMATFDITAAFWTAVTDTRLSPRRGDHDQFATLLPPTGDASVRLQGVDSGDGGAHVDFEVDDPVTMVEHAVGLGAQLEVAYDDGLVVLRSPTALPFCVMGWEGASTPGPATKDAGAVSRLDQICLDIPPAEYDVEAAFWSRLTGWPLRVGGRPEFGLLRPERGSGLPLQILTQRLTEERPAGAHLDLACSDTDLVRRLHEAHGAETVRRGAHWIVMRDPAGGCYCLTDRDPR